MRFTGEQFLKSFSKLSSEMKQAGSMAEELMGKDESAVQDYKDASSIAGVYDWISAKVSVDPKFGATEFDLPNIEEHVELERALDNVVGSFALGLLDAGQTLDDLSPRQARLILAADSKDNVAFDQTVNRALKRDTKRMDGIKVEGIIEVTVELLRLLHW